MMTKQQSRKSTPSTTSKDSNRKVRTVTTSRLKKYMRACRSAASKRPEKFSYWLDKEVSVHGNFLESGDLRMYMVLDGAEEPYQSDVIIPANNIEGFVNWMIDIIGVE